MAKPSSSRASGVRTELGYVGREPSELELARRNFHLPKQEWRRLFAEILGPLAGGPDAAPGRAPGS